MFKQLIVESAEGSADRGDDNNIIQA